VNDPLPEDSRTKQIPDRRSAQYPDPSGSFFRQGEAEAGPPEEAASACGLSVTRGHARGCLQEASHRGTPAASGKESLDDPSAQVSESPLRVRLHTKLSLGDAEALFPIVSSGTATDSPRIDDPANKNTDRPPVLRPRVRLISVTHSAGDVVRSSRAEPLEFEAAQLSTRRDAELPVDVLKVILDCLPAHIELRRCVWVGVPLRHKHCDVALSVGEIERRSG
jgi:hypothetical protein